MWQIKTRNMDELIIYEHATFWIDNAGILFCKLTSLDAQNKLDFKIANKYIDAIVKLSNGIPRPFVIDLRDTKGTFSIAGAQVLSNALSKVSLVISEAYIVNTLSMNLLIHSYKRLYNTTIPFEIFNNDASALAYCLESKNN